MAKTPLTSATPYCTAARLMQHYDREQVQDLLRTGDAPRPTYLGVTDPTSTEGARLQRVLLAASGKVESACLCGRRYSPADLAALTGAGLARLERLVAAIAFWELSQARMPNTGDPQEVPGAAEAAADLEMLRQGERVFSFDEAAAAGLPATTTPDPSQLLGGSSLVANNRMFGSAGGSRRGYR